MLKFYRDSLPCVVILGVAGAIRHGNPEKLGNATDSGCGREENYVPADAAGVTSRTMAQAHLRCAVQCCQSVSNNPSPRASCDST